MKKLLLTLLAALLLYVGYWFVKETFFHPPRTFVKMFEGSASVYYVSDKGEQEYLGILHPGESITALPMDRGPFAALNVGQMFVPQATSIFKVTVAKFAADKPLGIHKYLFTEDAFDQSITSKFKSSWLPDAKVTIREDGFTASGTIEGLPGPVYVRGIVGVDKKRHGVLYVYFKDVSIGKFHLPRFLLDQLADASTKLMGKGSFAIEIMDMEFRDGAINITYRKVKPTGEGLEEKGSIAMSGSSLCNQLKATVKQYV